MARARSLAKRSLLRERAGKDVSHRTQQPRHLLRSSQQGPARWEKLGISCEADCTPPRLLHSHWTGMAFIDCNTTANHWIRFQYFARFSFQRSKTARNCEGMLALSTQAGMTAIATWQIVLCIVWDTSKRLYRNLDHCRTELTTKSLADVRYFVLGF